VIPSAAAASTALIVLLGAISSKKPPTVSPAEEAAPIPEVAIPVPIPTPRLIPVNKVPIAPSPLASAIGTPEVYAPSLDSLLP